MFVLPAASLSKTLSRYLNFLLYLKAPKLAYVFWTYYFLKSGHNSSHSIQNIIAMLCYVNFILIEQAFYYSAQHFNRYNFIARTVITY